MLYAEDLTAGRVFETGSWHVTADAIQRFAREWDPLPLHTDEQAATAGPFGGLIASGLHTLAISVRLATDAFTSHVAVYAGRAMRELRLLKPLRPDVTVHGAIEILDQRLRDDGRGVIVWQNQLVDSDGEAVLRCVFESVVHRRPTD